ncbi:MAG: hypothetical protein ABI632_09180 [Pseudolysinimonas sp.]
MAEVSTPESPAPGVARIVKLGAETLLITRIEGGADLPDGEFKVKAIAVVPDEGPSGAGICEARVSCSSNCVVRLHVADDVLEAETTPEVVKTEPEQ